MSLNSVSFIDVTVTFTTRQPQAIHVLTSYAVCRGRMLQMFQKPGNAPGWRLEISHFQVAWNAVLVRTDVSPRLAS